MVTNQIVENEKQFQIAEIQKSPTTQAGKRKTWLTLLNLRVVHYCYR